MSVTVANSSFFFTTFALKKSWNAGISLEMSVLSFFIGSFASVNLTAAANSKSCVFRVSVSCLQKLC